MSVSFLSLLPPLLSPSSLRTLDERAIKFGVPEILLMENAARAALDVVGEKFAPLAGKSVWLVMGGGNNGGDAACLSRLLAEAGALPRLFYLKAPEDYKGAAAFHLDLALRDNIPACRIDPDAADLIFQKRVENDGAPNVLIDAILGTGFHGELSASAKRLIESFNRFAKLYAVGVLAIDIPSGLNAETGLPSPIAVKAYATVSFAAGKPGLCLSSARAYSGDVFVKNIGFPRSVKNSVAADWALLDGRALLPAPPRVANGYKNIYGHVLLVGGAPGMSGAIRVAALAALRAGAGLATVCAPENSLAAVAAALPEAMTLSLGADWPDTLPPNFDSELSRRDALVIGPGIGRDESAARFLLATLSLPDRPPAVIDADALYILGEKADSFDKYIRNDDILTPHPAEAGYLLGASAREIQKDRPRALRALCEKTPATIILKGANTIIGRRGETPLLCPYDEPRLSIGGAGDALAGCVGALRAAKSCPNSLTAAAEAVALCALTARSVSREFPERGMLASDLANALPRTREYLRSLDQTVLKNGLAPWPSN